MTRRLTKEDFVASSIIRFGALGEYIQEKMLIDSFAVKGNLAIASGLRQYLAAHEMRLREAKKIRILDIGPAIGAVTTLLVLQELEKFGLFHKTRVHFMDVSERVVRRTKNMDFLFPSMLVDPSLETKIGQKFRDAKGVVASCEHIPWKENYFDVVLSGFLFHHLHDSIKPDVAREVFRVCSRGGFIGVADEWFKDYRTYAKRHAKDAVPLAYESLISFPRLLRLFSGLQIFASSEPADPLKHNFYFFCGVKQGLADKAGRSHKGI